jgi:hypothetical protein
MIDRYEHNCEADRLEKHPKGEWVKYTDVKKVVQEAYKNGKKEGQAEEKSRQHAMQNAHTLVYVKSRTNL